MQQGGQGAHVSGGSRELRDKTQDNLGVLGEFITNTLCLFLPLCRCSSSLINGGRMK